MSKNGSSTYCDQTKLSEQEVMLITLLLCTHCIVSKLCENTKKYNYAYPGSNKVVYGACEQESENFFLQI